MRKINLILFFCLISVMTYAQKFETTLNVAPTMTFGRIIYFHDEISTAFGISGSIQEFYIVTEKFAIGSELNYSIINNKFVDRLYTGEGNFRNESRLNIQTLNVPINLRYKTLKKWMFQAGYGLTYVLDSKLNVDHVYNDYSHDNALKRIPINEKSDDLKRDFNSYFTVSFGKGFTIRNTDATIQIYFEQTIHDYSFSYGDNDPNTEHIYEYSFNPQLIGLRLGIKL
jgi:hypothetical protein